MIENQNIEVKKISFSAKQAEQVENKRYSCEPREKDVFCGIDIYGAVHQMKSIDYNLLLTKILLTLILNGFTSNSRIETLWNMNDKIFNNQEWLLKKANNILKCSFYNSIGSISKVY